MAENRIIHTIEEAGRYIREQIPCQPEIGLILGSGLGILAEIIEEVVTIPYASIPHFPVSTVEGHAGELLIGKAKGKRVVTMKGRFHMYEGYEADKVAFPIRVMKALGVHTLLVTNAAGGINESFEAGDLVLIKDHVS